MSENLAQTLEQPIVVRNIRYRLVYAALKKNILAARPRSPHELTKRIEEYLRAHPKSASIISKAGISTQKIVAKLLPYAK